MMKVSDLCSRFLPLPFKYLILVPIKVGHGELTQMPRCRERKGTESQPQDEDQAGQTERGNALDLRLNQIPHHLSSLLLLKGFGSHGYIRKLAWALLEFDLPRHFRRKNVKRDLHKGEARF